MRSAVRDQERGQVCFRLFTWTLPPPPLSPWNRNNYTQGMPAAYHIPLRYRSVPEPQMPHFRVGVDHCHGFLLFRYYVSVGIGAGVTRKSGCGF